jgi:hypothetical protein
VTVLVEDNGSYGHPRRRRNSASSSEKCLDTETELFETERLGEIVVTTFAKARPEIIDVITCSEEDHGYVESVAADPTAHLKAVKFRHVHVKYYKIGSLILDASQSVEAVALCAHFVAGETESAANHIGKRFFVVDHENGRIACGSVFHDVFTVEGLPWRFLRIG